MTGGEAKKTTNSTERKETRKAWKGGPRRVFECPLPECPFIAMSTMALKVHHDVKHGEGKDLAKELEHAPG